MTKDNNRTESNQEEIDLTLNLDLGGERSNYAEIRAGDVCPQCGQAEIDYDGMLNLVCPNCGFSLMGCFT